MKKICIAGLIVVSVSGAFWALFLRCPEPVLPEDPQPEDLVAIIASRSFDKLPQEKKSELIDAMVASRKPPSSADAKGMPPVVAALDEEAQHRFHEVMRQNFRVKMNERINEYFALPPEARQEYLDEMIDEQQERGGPGGGPGGGGPGRGGPPGSEGPAGGESSGQPSSNDGAQAGRPSPQDHMRSRIEGTAPEERAKHLEFMKAMQQRRTERGL